MSEMTAFDVGELVSKLAEAAVDDDSELSFADQGLKLDSEDDAKKVVEAIKNCDRLTALRMEGNTVGIGAARAIGKALESHSELKRALWRDMFTGRLKSEIPTALMYLGSGLMFAEARLVELDLSDNAFGPIGVDGISELLMSPTCFTLKELRLNNNGLGIHGGKTLASSLMECHTKSTATGQPLQLKVFICGRNRLENEGMTALAEVFKVLGSLEEIQMPQNGVFFEGIEALARSLQFNVGLQHLNLNDNILTEAGAKAIAEVLPKLQNLKIANFGDCLLKSGGARMLADALKDEHMFLKELHLSYNEINSTTAMLVVEALENKQHLEKLELNGNQIGEEGCEIIRGMLETINKPDILGSLSDDEGEADDEDDDGEDEEGEEDEDGKDEDYDDYNDEETDDVVGNKSANDSDNKENVPEFSAQVKYSASEFLAVPTAGKLLGLGNQRADALLEELSKDSRGVEKYASTFVKVASCVRQHGEKAVERAACECADALLSKGFKEAKEEGTCSIFTNSLLVYLGLIKSEDKTVRPPSDLVGPLIVLEHVVRQPYFPRPTKEILKLFLSMFHGAVERTGPVKHRLMQTLYQY